MRISANFNTWPMLLFLPLAGVRIQLQVKMVMRQQAVIRHGSCELLLIALDYSRADEGSIHRTIGVLACYFQNVMATIHTSHQQDFWVSIGLP